MQYPSSFNQTSLLHSEYNVCRKNWDLIDTALSNAVHGKRGTRKLSAAAGWQTAKTALAILAF